MTEKKEPTATLSRTGSDETGHENTGRHLKTLAAIMNGLLKGNIVPFDPAELCTDTRFAEVFNLLHELAVKLSDAGDRDRSFPKTDTAKTGDREMLLPVFAAITDAVFVLDNNGSIVLCNPAAEELCRKPAAAMRGKKIPEMLTLINELTLEPCADFKETLANEECPKEQRCQLMAEGGGAEKIVSMHSEVLSDSARKPLGIVVIIRDCTQQELFEEKLLRIRKLESVGLLAGGIAHDFNNILTGIITNLFMARMSVFKNEEACQLIADAEKAAFKATRLTKQLLTFSMGGAPVKEQISVSQLIEETVGFSLSGSNVDYRLNFDEELKPVEVDKGQIDQVVNNLVINAAQAMPEGGTVTIVAENCTLSGKSEADNQVFSVPGLPLVEGEYVKISVRDDGPGIPRKHLGKIFDPYFSTKTGSTGLGLTTAYSIVKKHGGHIEVESRPGEGTVFSFFLPAASEESSENRQEKFEEGKACGKVLVMDDDLIIRTVVEKLLKKTGYNVECVSNGEDALRIYNDALAADDPFKFVLMDLTIPGGMGGKETVTKIKDFDENAKVIVFSGYSNDPILSNFKEYGFDGVLKKPFSTDELLVLIQNIGNNNDTD
ncbi:MAG: response regulator [Chitinispirillaceae bacterium]|nr:response regulator [Chitinispirillaceae bacterium]